MNTPSFYQADMFRALVATNAVDLTVVFSRPLGKDRTTLGWRDDIHGFPSITLNGERAILQAANLAWHHRRRVHIVGGLWAEPTIMAALVVLRSLHCRYLNYAEVPNPLVTRSSIKTLGKHAFARWAIHKETGLLAISRLSSDYYLRLGFAANHVYEFGYFLTGYDVPPAVSPENTINLIYIGQLIPRKGVDLLIDAFAGLQSAYPNLTLTLVGDGPERERYENMAKPFSNRVSFMGVLPSDQIRAYLSGFHALVLPSRHDGWGVVINEALSVGIPAIVSSTCGAADLIQDGKNGYVFSSEDVDSLRSCLQSFVTQNYTERQAMRGAARNMGVKISAEVVAPYFVQCLQHMLEEIADKPIPPWKSTENS